MMYIYNDEKISFMAIYIQFYLTKTFIRNLNMNGLQFCSSLSTKNTILSLNALHSLNNLNYLNSGKLEACLKILMVI